MTNEEAAHRVYDLMTLGALGDAAGVERMIAAMTVVDAVEVLAYLVGLSLGMAKEQAERRGTSLLGVIAELRQIAASEPG